MARFTYAESDNYGSGNSSFFQLRDDKETAQVRFLLNDINDMIGVSCHNIKVGDKQIDVECIRTYNEPVDNCPLCAAGYKVNANLFVPLYDTKNKTYKIWKRGKTFYSKLSSLCARYNPLVSTIFEIERQGKKGDTNTTYETFVIETDNKKLSDFNIPEIDGVAFETKTFDELANFVATGNFETHERRQAVPNDGGRQVPARRRPVEEDDF